jgi:predicted O-methyltransferase YrrM
MISELIWRAFEFFKFFLKAQLPEKISDSDLNIFLTDILNFDEEIRGNKKVELVRNESKKDKSELKFFEFGAGERFEGTKRINSILSKSVSSEIKCKTLQNISKKTGNGEIIEIGSSLGFVSAYLGIGSPDKKVYTFEGNSSIVKYAESFHKNMEINNIHVIEGDFENTLDRHLDNLNEISFAFIDGNHRENATIRYFEKILNKCNDNSIIVIDDIYWSLGMKKAWNKIKQYPGVSSSIDLFQVGIVMLNPRFKGNYRVIKSRINPIF